MFLSTSRFIRATAGALVALAIGAPAAHGQSPDAGLTEPRQALERALECRGDVAGRAPVLLVHGTSSSPEESFSWGYIPALTSLGIPVCTVQLPEHGLVDMQRSMQYVVYAVREAARISQRKVSLIGHSQGAVLAAYAPYFWPDLPAMIDDVIGLAGPYLGTTGADASCASGTCSTVAWQFRPGSKLNAAYRAKPQPAGPSFTAIATSFDQLVTPAPQAARLDGAANIVVQDVCPGRPIDHFKLVGDAVAYALALDALTHPGGADPSRVDRSAVCLQALMPGADLAKAAATIPVALANALARVVAAPQVDREPELRCPFDAADCSAEQQPLAPQQPHNRQLRLTRRCAGGGRLRVALTGDVHAVRDVEFKLGSRVVRRDRSAPFAGTVALGVSRRARRPRVRAIVRIEGASGKRLVLSRSRPRCGA